MFNIPFQKNQQSGIKSPDHELQVHLENSGKLAPHEKTRYRYIHTCVTLEE